jgi:hypothetical protein
MNITCSTVLPSFRNLPGGERMSGGLGIASKIVAVTHLSD